ncbi:hypothetical protein [Microbacterium sp. NPDC090003]|uniref:hypothetical protein n=1 Tax=Microbacterium sp. NPDC090003 TaxID=3364203 RepID=UPI00382E1BDD
MIRRTRRGLAALALTATVSIALLGCSTADDGPDRDAGTGQVTEEATIDIVALEVGDCIMDAPSGLREDIDVVPCTASHDQEVFHEIIMPDGDFSETDIDAASMECIGDPYTAFVGIEKAESVFEVFPLVPSETSWDEHDDRTIQCVVFDPAGPVTGTLAGASR